MAQGKSALPGILKILEEDEAKTGKRSDVRDALLAYNPGYRKHLDEGDYDYEPPPEPEEPPEPAPPPHVPSDVEREAAWLIRNGFPVDDAMEQARRNVAMEGYDFSTRDAPPRPHIHPGVDPDGDGFYYVDGNGFVISPERARELAEDGRFAQRVHRGQRVNPDIHAYYIGDDGERIRPNAWQPKWEFDPESNHFTWTDPFSGHTLSQRAALPQNIGSLPALDVEQEVRNYIAQDILKGYSVEEAQERAQAFAAPFDVRGGTFGGGGWKPGGLPTIRGGKPTKTPYIDEDAPAPYSPYGDHIQDRIVEGVDPYTGDPLPEAPPPETPEDRAGNLAELDAAMDAANARDEEFDRIERALRAGEMEVGQAVAWANERMYGGASPWGGDSEEDRAFRAWASAVRDEGEAGRRLEEGGVRFAADGLPETESLIVGLVDGLVDARDVRTFYGLDAGESQALDKFLQQARELEEEYAGLSFARTLMLVKNFGLPRADLNTGRTFGFETGADGELRMSDEGIAAVERFLEHADQGRLVVGNEEARAMVRAFYGDGGGELIEHIDRPLPSIIDDETGLPREGYAVRVDPTTGQDYRSVRWTEEETGLPREAPAKAPEEGDTRFVLRTTDTGDPLIWIPMNEAEFEESQRRPPMTAEQLREAMLRGRAEDEFQRRTNPYYFGGEAAARFDAEGNTLTGDWGKHDDYGLPVLVEDELGNPLEANPMVRFFDEDAGEWRTMPQDAFDARQTELAAARERQKIAAASGDPYVTTTDDGLQVVRFRSASGDQEVSPEKWRTIAEEGAVTDWFQRTLGGDFSAAPLMELIAADAERSRPYAPADFDFDAALRGDIDVPFDVREQMMDRRPAAFSNNPLDRPNRPVLLQNDLARASNEYHAARAALAASVADFGPGHEYRRAVEAYLRGELDPWPFRELALADPWGGWDQPPELRAAERARAKLEAKVGEINSMFSGDYPLGRLGKDVVISMVPYYGTKHHWDDMADWEKTFAVSLDAWDTGTALTTRPITTVPRAGAALARGIYRFVRGAPRLRETGQALGRSRAAYRSMSGGSPMADIRYASTLPGAGLASAAAFPTAAPISLNRLALSGGGAIGDGLRTAVGYDRSMVADTAANKWQTPPFPLAPEGRAAQVLSFPVLQEGRGAHITSFPVLQEGRGAHITSFPVLQEGRGAFVLPFPTIREGTVGIRADAESAVRSGEAARTGVRARDFAGIRAGARVRAGDWAGARARTADAITGARAEPAALAEAVAVPYPGVGLDVDARPVVRPVPRVIPRALARTLDIARRPRPRRPRPRLPRIDFDLGGGAFGDDGEHPAVVRWANDGHEITYDLHQQTITNLGDAPISLTPDETLEIVRRGRRRPPPHRKKIGDVALAVGNGGRVIVRDLITDDITPVTRRVGGRPMR